MYSIAVLGGGYAGVKLTKGLLNYSKNSSVKYKVVLIDRNDFQCLLPSLPAAISNRLEKIIIKYEEAFGGYSNFEFVKGEIDWVNFNSKTVILADGKEVKYDHVVLCFGVQPADFGIEGVRQYSIMFWNEKDLERYMSKLKAFIEQNKSPRIVIVGAGPVGVEVASETYHYLRSKKIIPNITIIEAKDRCLPNLPAKFGKLIEKYLTKRNINLVYNSAVCKVDDKKTYTSDNKEIEYDILLWCSGVSANRVLEQMENKAKVKFERGPQGRLVVDEFLRVKNFKDVWAVGDTAVPENQNTTPMPLAQFAVQMAEVASFNIPRSLEGKELKKLRLSFKGIVVQMSRYSAGAILKFPFEITIPPSIFGVFLRKFVDYNYILSIGAKPRRYPL